MNRKTQLRTALDDVVTKITWRPDKTALVHDSEALNTLIGCVVMATSEPEDAEARASQPLTLDVGTYREGFHEGWARAAAVVNDHETHEAEMCGADCITLGLASSDDAEPA